MIKITLAIAGFISLLGCALSNPVPKSQTSDDYFRYSIVRQGENLATISSWYCADEKLWTKFFIPSDRDTKTLRPGDVILIPRSLVRRTDAIAQTFVEANRPIFRKSTTPSPRLKDPEPANEQLNSSQPAENTEKDSDRSVQDDFLNTLSQPANTPS